MSSKVTVIHLDLGQGGAERQTLDECLALRKLGCDVEIATTHFDISRCFDEAKEMRKEGRIEIYGDWIPRHILGGRFHALMSLVRMAYCCLKVCSQPDTLTIINDNNENLNKNMDEPQQSDLPGERKSDLLTGGKPLIFVDQVSGVIPLLKALTLGNARIIFYCHFPDKLVAESLDCYNQRGQGGSSSWLSAKHVYRSLVDWIERLAMRNADAILFNSQFTRDTTLKLWPELDDDQQSSDGNQKSHLNTKKRILKRVVYPCIRLPSEDHRFQVQCQGRYFLSINRFERKKDIMLALHSFAHVLKKLGRELGRVKKKGSKKKNNDNNNNNQSVIAPENDKESEKPMMKENENEVDHRRLHLVIAGGYDKRLSENVEYLNELKDQCRKYGIQSETIRKYPEIPSVDNDAGLASMMTLILNEEANVHFVLAFPDWVKDALLRSEDCISVLYTPTNEHFGIVPLEAMSYGNCVIASNTGGPKETVVHGLTGFLCSSSKASEWSGYMLKLLDSMEEESEQKKKDSNVSKKDDTMLLSRKMGMEGMERVRNQFSVAQLSKELGDMIEQLNQPQSSEEREFGNNGLDLYGYALAFVLLLMVTVFTMVFSLLTPLL